MKNPSEIFQYYFYDDLLSGFGLINCLNHVEEEKVIIFTAQICERARQIFLIIVSISLSTNDTSEIDL